MKTRLCIVACLLVLHIAVNAQMKIGNNPTTINSASLLELESTNKGLVFPKVSLTSTSSSTPLPTGLLTGTVVYNTNTSVTGGNGVGLYVWNGSAWLSLASGSIISSLAWNLTGNSSTNSGINFLGTTDNISLRLRTNNNERMVIDSLGRVGIGLRNPTYALSVLSASNPLYLSGVQATSTFGTDSILTINNGVVKKTASSTFNTAWALTGNTGTSYANNFLGTTDNTSVRFRTNNNERMIIDSLGNVGIGSSAFNYSTNPAKLLVDYGSTTSNTIVNLKGSSPSYFQLNIQNQSNDVNASSDIVATADNGTDTTNYIDMGINSSNYSTGPDYWGGPNDGYLYTYSRNLLIGTQKASSDIIFLVTGGSIKNNTALRILGPSGNIVVGRGENSSNPVGNILRGPNANSSSTNTAGGTLTVSGGKSTGTGAGGSVIINGGAGSGSGPGGDINIGGGLSSTGTNGDIILNTSGNEIMRLNAVGNVGIGVSNPSNKLSVLSSTDPLYLSGVQATSSFSTDSILTINAGIVKKTPYSSLQSASSGWSLTGNTGTNPATNFLGTKDANALVFKVNNTATGYLGTSSNYAIAFGLGSSGASTANQSIAIGANAQATGSNASIALGYNALANSQDDIAIGDNAQAKNNNEAVAIGHNSTATSYQGISFGVSSSSSANQTIAIGTSSNASSYQGIAIGNGASATTNNQALAIGASSSASGYQSIAIGNGSSATSNNQSMAIGVNASASGAQSTSIGNGASATASNATAVGNGAIANTANTLILGNNVNVGIGTSSPGNKLEITQGSSGNSGLRFTNLTNANTPVANPSSQAGVLSVNSSGDVILVKEGSTSVVTSSNSSGSSCSSCGGNTYTLAPATSSLNVSVGDVIVIQANLMIYATGGTNTNNGSGGDFVIIKPVTSGTATISWSSGTTPKNLASYAPPDNRGAYTTGILSGAKSYPGVSPTDYVEYGTVTTGGTLSASLQGTITTDDPWAWNNAVLLIRKN